MKIKIQALLAVSIYTIMCCFSLNSCNNDDKNETHEHNYIVSVINPTCDEEGFTLHKCACGDEYKDQYISSLGHCFGNPTYEWNGQECTATRVCLNNSSHTEIETVLGEYVKDTNATTTSPELGHYKAVFKNPAFEEQQTPNNSISCGEPQNPDIETPIIG